MRTGQEAHVWMAVGGVKDSEGHTCADGSWRDNIQGGISWMAAGGIMDRDAHVRMAVGGIKGREAYV